MKPVRRMGLHPQLPEKPGQRLRIEPLQCRLHEPPLLPKPFHEGFIVELIGEVTPPPAGRLQLGTAPPQLLQHQHPLTTPSRHYRRHHPRRPGTDDSEVI